jgi:hypothetical protein
MGMQVAHVEKLINQLSTFVRRTSLGFGEGGDKQYSAASTLDPAGDQLMGDLLSELLEDRKIRERVSRSYIESKVRGLLFSKSEGTSVSVDECRQLINAFREYSKDWTVLIPVVGIGKVPNDFRVGRVLFRKYDEPTINQLVDFLHTRDREEGSSRERLVEFLQPLQDAYCGEINILGDPEHAKEQGRFEVQLALDILRICGRMFCSDARILGLGLKGEVFFKASRTVIVYHENEDEFHITSVGTGPALLMNIEPGSLEWVEDAMFAPLSELAAKKNDTKTKFEKSLLLAIHWLASALANREETMRFLNLFMVIEVLIKREDEYSITKYISENVSLLIEHRPAERLALAKELRKLYGIRSKIVHEGAILTDPRSSERLELMALSVLMTCVSLTEKVTDVDSMQAYLERKRLARELDT